MDMYFWLPTISTSFIVISAVLVGIGWVLIIRGKREAHQSAMVAGAIAGSNLLCDLYVANGVRG